LNQPINLRLALEHTTLAALDRVHVAGDPGCGPTRRPGDEVTPSAHSACAARQRCGLARGGRTEGDGVLTGVLVGVALLVTTLHEVQLKTERARWGVQRGGPQPLELTGGG
jgi:hypothetical protein